MTDSSAATNLPQIAIVGRPNVGKSTLFNRVIGRREAIVGSHYGMTRDRHTADSDWNGLAFRLVDTGGIDHRGDGQLRHEVERQVLQAVEASQIVLLVVDGREGPLSVDAEIAQRLRRRGVTPWLVINKCDRADGAVALSAAFCELGLEMRFAISAEHGFGVADVLDAVTAALPAETASEGAVIDGVRVAFVGRPNVGKSSLVNAVLGVERVIVSDIPGTTRDAIDTSLERDGKRYVIVDTAGMRKRARIDTHAEIASVAMARKRLERADVALLVVDAEEGVTRQDLHVAAAAEQVGCGLVVVVNKWDTVPAQQAGSRAEAEDYVRQRMGRMSYARVAITSALAGTGVDKLLPTIDEVAAARARRFPTAALNAAFAGMLGRHAPAGGTSASAPKFLVQVGINPPRFVAFAAGRGAQRADYNRYLENRLRDTFDLAGAPVVVTLRRGGGKRHRSKR